MFHLIEQLKLNDDNQCICNHDDDEITDKDMMNAATAMSSINNTTKTKSYETLCVWMVLYVGMNGQVQRTIF